MKFLKTAGKLSALCAGVWIAILTHVHFQARPLRDFCHSLKPGMAPQAVVAAANQAMFMVDDLAQTHGVVAVYNRKAPLFRMVCRVSFQNGGMVAADFGAGD